jgi:hypothetical protein
LKLNTTRLRRSKIKKLLPHWAGNPWWPSNPDAAPHNRIFDIWEPTLKTSSKNMQLSTFSLKTMPGLYCAISPEFGLISYGTCQDEAINNLQNELASYRAAGGGESHAG